MNQKLITGASFPDAIAAGSRYLYWTSAFGRAIGRARLDGDEAGQMIGLNADARGLVQKGDVEGLRLITFSENEGHLAGYHRQGEILDELLARG